mgnify:CR=1 FL=1
MFHYMLWTDSCFSDGFVMIYIYEPPSDISPHLSSPVGEGQIPL